MLMNQAVVQSSGMRVVVSVFNQGQAPLDQLARDEYCTYVGRVLTRFPQVNDVVIWNEPNLRFFWRPQYDTAGATEAPARYQELLARCWDVLHGIRPSVNVVAPGTSAWGNDNPNAFSNVSHSPAVFIKGMGAAYGRAAGRCRCSTPTRTTRTPARSDERPWATHSDEKVISLGDIDRLLGALREAFGGGRAATEQTASRSGTSRPATRPRSTTRSRASTAGSRTGPGRSPTGSRGRRRRSRRTTARRPIRRRSSRTASA